MLFVLFLTLASVPKLSAGANVRIGVFGLFHPAELVLRPTSGTVLYVEAGGETFRLEGAESARFRLAGDRVQCLTRQRNVSARALRASARGGAGDLWLSVPGKIARRFRGRLEVRAHRGALEAVILMDREVAVAAAVAAESPPGALLEALKAQAVVTRSYYAATPNRHIGFDFCDTTHCQFLRESPEPNDPASLATVETRGLLLGYRGAAIAALFSASCGGRTSSLAQVGMRSEGYPYYSVECLPCRHGARRWVRRLEEKDAGALLKGESSELLRLRLGRKIGWSAVPGNNYDARREAEKVLVRGRGAGHGLGFCQVGGAAMARSGANFRELLNHYYPNTMLIAVGD